MPYMPGLAEYPLTRSSLNTNLQTVLNHHLALFSDELGCVKGVKARICGFRSKTMVLQVQDCSFCIPGESEQEIRALGEDWSD